MANTQQLEDLKAGWAALAVGDMDKLASFYADDMIFVLPGQNDVLEGRTAFRAALDGIGQALPPGFEIKDLRYCQGDNEIVNVVEFTADKLPNGSQCAILFKFGDDGLITEERWFVDTEQWKAAF
jgi:ketosteroid isomerase-like protein